MNKLIFVTTECNLKCEYCFRNIPNLAPQTKSLDSIKQEIYKSDNQSFILTGGEPLINGTDTVLGVIDAFKNKSFSLQTNGLTLTKMSLISLLSRQNLNSILIGLHIFTAGEERYNLLLNKIIPEVSEYFKDNMEIMNKVFITIPLTKEKFDERMPLIRRFSDYPFVKNFHVVFDVRENWALYSREEQNEVLLSLMEEVNFLKDLDEYRQKRGFRGLAQFLQTNKDDRAIYGLCAGCKLGQEEFCYRHCNFQCLESFSDFALFLIKVVEGITGKKYSYSKPLFLGLWGNWDLKQITTATLQESFLSYLQLINPAIDDVDFSVIIDYFR